MECEVLMMGGVGCAGGRLRVPWGPLLRASDSRTNGRSNQGGHPFCQIV